MELSEAIERQNLILKQGGHRLDKDDINALCMVNTAARVLIKLTTALRQALGNQVLT